MKASRARFDPSSPANARTAARRAASALPAALAAALLAGCAGSYALVDRQSLQDSQAVAAQQEQQQMNLMTQQQQQTERLLQEQQRLSEVLDRLHATLSQPLRLGQPVIHVHPAQVTMNAPAPITPVPVKPAENLPQLGSKQMVGAIEDVYFPDLDLTVTSRIDTGAGLSSIDATEMEEFERDGKKWVRFKMTFTDDKEALELEQRLLRHVRVRQSITDDYERRPVIELQTVIGTVSQKTEFTLTDRSHLDYSVLIGRNGLRDVMVVDVSRKKLTKPKTSKP